jgi:hypothetical protein
MDGHEKLDAGVPFSGALSHVRFVAIQRAMTPWWGRLYMTWLTLCALQFYFSDRDFLDTLGDPVEALSTAILSTAGVLFLWVLTRFVWRRAWRKSMALHGGVTGRADAEHIQWRTQFANSEYQWNKFIRARSGPDLLLLHYSARCALYFPREFFASDEDWAAFRALVDSKLPSQRMSG